MTSWPEGRAADRATAARHAAGVSTGLRDRRAAQDARAALAVLLVLALSGCTVDARQQPARQALPDVASRDAPRPVVSGTATYRERIALPAGAEFEAVIEDVSKAGAPAVVLARTRSKPVGVPIPFSIQYDPALLDPRARYSVRARILVDGRLWFTSDTLHPVLRDAGDSRVDILMRRAGSGP